MDYQNHSRWPEAFSLNADAETFLTWLDQHIKAIPKLAHGLNVEDMDGGKLATCGYLTGRNVDRKGQEVPAVRPRHINPWDDSVNAERYGLGFKVLRFASERVQVHAGYMGDAETDGYFREILKDVQDAYPESRDVINRHLGEPTKRDLSGAAKDTGADAEETAISDIPEGRGKEWVRLWRRGLTAPEIAAKFKPIEPKTVLNTLCSLRTAHGEIAVPYRRGKSKAK